MKKPWQKGMQRAIALPEDHPNIFDMFFHFSLTGSIFSSRDRDYTEAGPGDYYHTDAEWSRLGNAWSLGEKLQATSFKDAVVDAMMAKIIEQQVWPATLYRTIFPVSSKASAIRKFLVDVAIWHWGDRALVDQANDPNGLSKHPEFVPDLALALYTLRHKGRTGTAPFLEESCHYHEHVAEGKPCYKTMF